jgi:hypothetical protein
VNQPKVNIESFSSSSLFISFFVSLDQQYLIASYKR